PQERAQGRPGRGRLDGEHLPRADVDAMDRPEVLGQLQHAIGPSTVERAEKVSERRPSQPTGELHEGAGITVRRNGPRRWRRGEDAGGGEGGGEGTRTGMGKREGEGEGAGNKRGARGPESSILLAPWRFPKLTSRSFRELFDD